MVRPHDEDIPGFVSRADLINSDAPWAKLWCLTANAIATVQQRSDQLGNILGGYDKQVSCFPVTTCDNAFEGMGLIFHSREDADDFCDRAQAHNVKTGWYTDGPWAAFPVANYKTISWGSIQQIEAARYNYGPTDLLPRSFHRMQAAYLHLLYKDAYHTYWV